MLFSFSGVWFFSVECESEVKIDNIKDEYLIINDQVKKTSDDLYIWLSKKQGKHNLLSAHI